MQSEKSDRQWPEADAVNEFESSADFVSYKGQDITLNAEDKLVCFPRDFDFVNEGLLNDTFKV